MLDIREIEELNRKAKILNSQREQSIGRQTVAKNQYQEAVREYKEKYGVELNTSNLEQEYLNVQNEVIKDTNDLKKTILSIEDGSYKNNIQTASVGESNQTVVNNVNTVDSNVVEGTSNGITNTVNTSMIGYSGLGTSTNNTFGNTTTLETPKEVEKPNIEVEKPNLDVEKPNLDVGFTPSGWGTTTDTVNTNFEGILNGEFQL